MPVFFYLPLVRLWHKANSSILLQNEYVLIVDGHFARLAAVKRQAVYRSDRLCTRHKVVFGSLSKNDRFCAVPM